MQEWTVTVDGRDYDVDAADEREAWKKANEYRAWEKRQESKKAGAEADVALEGTSWGEKALATFGGGMKQALAGVGSLRSQTTPRRRSASTTPRWRWRPSTARR